MPGNISSAAKIGPRSIAAAVLVGRGISNNWQGRPLKGQRAAHFTLGAVKLFSRNDVIILKPIRLYAPCAYQWRSVGVRVISMFEVAIALGVFSAGIFLAHMLAAYRAR